MADEEIIWQPVKEFSAPPDEWNPEFRRLLERIRELRIVPTLYEAGTLAQALVTFISPLLIAASRQERGMSLKEITWDAAEATDRALFISIPKKNLIVYDAFTALMDGHLNAERTVRWLGVQNLPQELSETIRQWLIERAGMPFPTGKILLEKTASRRAPEFDLYQIHELPFEGR